MIKLKKILIEFGYNYDLKKSNNAIVAELRGEKTLNDLSNILQINKNILEKNICSSSWHHIGDNYKIEYYFYEPILIDIKHNIDVDTIKDNYVKKYSNIYYQIIDNMIDYYSEINENSIKYFSKRFSENSLKIDKIIRSEFKKFNYLYNQSNR